MWREKKSLYFLPPWEFQTPLSLGTPRLLINLPRNWLSQKTLESPLDCKEIQPLNPKGDRSVLNVHWKDWSWSWNSNPLATWCEELTHWKRSWCWDRLKAGGERHDRGWDGCMPSLTRWTWVWVSSGSWWWTGKPGGLQAMGSQRVRYDWATELNWNEMKLGLLWTVPLCSIPPVEVPKARVLIWIGKVSFWN